MTSAEFKPPSFVDTNVLVYAVASDDVQRSAAAQELLRELMRTQSLRTSTQILQELFVTLTTKVRIGMSSQEALHYLDQLAAWPVLVTDYSAIRDAAQLSRTARISFWDALVIIAARRAGANRVYTEDLNHGQTIHGVEIINPFRGTNETRA